MAEIVKVGSYDADNLASVAFHFGGKGEDAPVLALLEKGVDPDVTDRSGCTALDRAAQFDRPVVLRALLEAGANPDHRCISGATPLMSARSREAVLLLVQAGADVNAVVPVNERGDPAGATALMYAAWRGDSEIVRTLLENHADINARNQSGWNALLFAAWQEKDETARLLLEAGAHIGLVEAVAVGDYAQAQALLAAGADPDPREMRNALRWAVRSGHAHIVVLLLQNGVSVDAPDEYGRTALMEAADFGRTAMARLLLEHGANPNAAGQGGQTALSASIVSSAGGSRYDMVELLLSHGARSDVRHQSGLTPLMWACVSEEEGSVPLLLRHGADPNVFSDTKVATRDGHSNFNALMLAIRKGRTQVVKWLLQYGADPLARNDANAHALDIARNSMKHSMKHGYRESETEEILQVLEASVQNQ